jgi:hypothetical protein
VRRAALVLREARVDAQALLPDRLAAGAVCLDGSHASAHAVDHDLCVGLDAQVVVPARMLVLAEVAPGDSEHRAIDAVQDPGEQSGTGATRGKPAQHLLDDVRLVVSDRLAAQGVDASSCDDARSPSACARSSRDKASMNTTATPIPNTRNSIRHMLAPASRWSVMALMP